MGENFQLLTCIRNLRFVYIYIRGGGGKERGKRGGGGFILGVRRHWFVTVDIYIYIRGGGGRKGKSGGGRKGKEGGGGFILGVGLFIYI